jgi:small subunit ribosomal protein S16
MLKLRLKRGGRKGQPAYRIVIMKSDSRRDGRPIENLGYYYNPLSKEFSVNSERVKIRLSQGVKPTDTVKNLLIRANIISA